MNGFLNPNKVLDQLELHEDMVVAEFGCGAGGFTIPLAKRLKEGRAYALDVQEEPLSALKSKAELEGVINIKTIRCDLEKQGGSGLPDDFLDMVLVPNILFQTKDKEAVINEAKRILKQKGKILIIDWLPKVALGSKKGRISAEEVKKIAEKLGLEFEKEFEAGSYHYGLLFKKI